ncbi:MAG: sulfide/dihydroorotate dehydrogenase-like FAD/NAD-binding protein, partial [Oscillospiraceae bacterium]
HLVDFDEAIARGGMYKPFEQQKREETCNLFKGVK